MPQSQTADKPMALRGRTTQQIRDTRKTKLSKATSSDDCKTRIDIKCCTTKHRTITDSHNVSINKQQVNNNRTTALERTSLWRV